MASSSETILVVGATGMLGEPVARRLAADGHTIRVMGRDLKRVQSKFCSSKEKSFEAVQGDVENEESLKQSMNGCTGVHINLSGGGDWDLERRGAAMVSRVAAEMDGMKRITIITGASTCEENTWFPGTKAKLEAEQAIQASGVSYTIFRCTMFMETLHKWVQGKKAFIIGEQPTKWHWIAAQDYASMVSKAFSTPEAANKTLYIYGPEAHTMEEALNTYIAICAPGAKISKVPFWLMKIISWLPGNKDGSMLRKVLIPLFQYFAKISELGDSKEANALLGAPTTTVEDWCKAYEAKK